MSSKTCPGSPVEHTLEVLQARLLKAEEETQKLSTQVVNYGFKRLPAEKPDVDVRKHTKEDGKMVCLLEDVKKESDEVLVSRLCRMESTIESLRSGMKSLDLEKTTTTSEILKEKKQIQEEYQKELQKKKLDIQKYKSNIKVFENGKVLLEKQIVKLKEEITKQLEEQRDLKVGREETRKELELYKENCEKYTRYKVKKFTKKVLKHWNAFFQHRFKDLSLIFNMPEINR